MTETVFPAAAGPLILPLPERRRRCVIESRVVFVCCPSLRVLDQIGDLVLFLDRTVSFARWRWVRPFFKRYTIFPPLLTNASAFCMLVVACTVFLRVKYAFCDCLYGSNCVNGGSHRVFGLWLG